ncbi:MAG TPA: DNA alkylation repair protein [Bryobacteraceae bacterium]|jgi:3-methyladenine DNA glycosylase AlkD|nr:DNA alkylation repair protein [Bryobacteraceae bacterium]
MSKIDEVLKEMRAAADASKLEGMARFGIQPVKGLGLSVPQIRAIARRAGKNQRLAEQLWTTGIHEARILASMVADPELITRATMNRWTRDFASWDVCDSCCYDLFGRTPHAWAMIPKWAGHNREFVRRAAFATIAGIAVHDKQAGDRVFLDALPLVEKYAFDDRNFVRKGVNWALRNIGKRNPDLGKAAIACAERVRAQNSKAARWIAADALRELRRRYEPEYQ